MGYYASTRGACLRITDTKKAVKALNDAGHADATTLEDALGQMYYEYFAIDAKGNVEDLSFSDKYREEDIWRTLAPFIDFDTRYPKVIPFIEWLGEDDDRWRFVFREGRMDIEAAEVTWPYEDEPVTVKTEVTVEPFILEGTDKDSLYYLLERRIKVLSDEHGSSHPTVVEASMSLKAIDDADAIALSIETVE